MWQTLVLSYAYHCCEYMAPPAPDEPDEDEGLSDTVLLPPRVDPAAWANATDIYALYRESQRLLAEAYANDS